MFTARSWDICTSGTSGGLMKVKYLFLKKFGQCEACINIWITSLIFDKDRCSAITCSLFRLKHKLQSFHIKLKSWYKNISNCKVMLEAPLAILVCVWVKYILTKTYVHQTKVSIYNLLSDWMPSSQESFFALSLLASVSIGSVTEWKVEIMAYQE